jgi:vacuolar protein sorting-associated protein 13A/C
VLENLQLRKKALNSLGLPIKVKSGLIGSLQLKVPWHNIKNEPLIVTIQRVFLIAGPRPDNEVT